MLATEVKGLRVVFGALDPRMKTRWPDDGRECWRVSHNHPVSKSDGTVCYRTFPLQFARERDAVAAMNAIADLHDWSLSYEELVAVVDFNELRQRMVGAMAW